MRDGRVEQCRLPPAAGEGSVRARAELEADKKMKEEERKRKRGVEKKTFDAVDPLRSRDEKKKSKQNVMPRPLEHGVCGRVCYSKERPCCRVRERRSRKATKWP